MLMLQLVVILPALAVAVNWDLDHYNGYDKRQQAGQLVQPFGSNRRAIRVGSNRMVRALNFICEVTKKVENAEMGKTVEEVFESLKEACDAYGPIKTQLRNRLRQKIYLKVTPQPEVTSPPPQKRNKLEKRELVKALLQLL
ncbi:hypothetical protein SNE40_023351 [Patella caerulea]|uniref:Secreted protein n=1 Tax=Patella caerulea TaxID=87958 RepID=A0AAN8G692_PATCE